MKLVASLFTVLLTLATLAGAQEDTAPPPQPVVTDNFAYQILLGHYRYNEQTRGTSGKGFSFYLGSDFTNPLVQNLAGTSFMTGTIQHFWGDNISQAAYGKPMDPETKLISTLGLFGSWSLLSAANSQLSFRLVADGGIPALRRDFPEVLDAQDPAVQEDLARSAIRKIASEGRFKRLTGGAINILAPLAVSGLLAWSKQQSGTPWEGPVITLNTSMIGSFLGGLALLFQPTEGELLEARYLEAVSRGQR